MSKITFITRSIPYTVLHLSLWDLQSCSEITEDYTKVGVFSEDDMLEDYLSNMFDETKTELLGSHVTIERRKQRMPVEQFAREAIW